MTSNKTESIIVEEQDVMFPRIDKEMTGEQIRLLMQLRGLTVQEVKEFLSLCAVQSVYHWLRGQSLPTLDNLYAMSRLFQVPMDMIVIGEGRQTPKGTTEQKERLRHYFWLLRCISGIEA